MGIPRRSLAGVLTLVLCLVNSAHADNPRRKEAETAFQLGKDLMQQGRYAEACDQFQTSQDLDPQATSLMNLGACQEAKKKLYSAWFTFVEASKLAAKQGDAALGKASADRAAAIQPRLSTLEIIVADGARVPGLVVKRDTEILLPGQWNRAVPIDGGEYTIVAVATGTDVWTSTIAIASERDQKRVEIPALKPSKTDAAVPTPDVPTPDVPTAAQEEPVEAGEPEVPPSSPSTFTGLRKAALGVAAVGVVALAGGAVFGMKANSTQADADAICPGTECTDPEAIRLNDDAKSAAGTANLLLIGGGVAVAGGVALWFLGAPTADSADGDLSITPHVGQNGIGLSLAGGF